MEPRSLAEPAAPALIASELAQARVWRRKSPAPVSDARGPSALFRQQAIDDAGARPTADRPERSVLPCCSGVLTDGPAAAPRLTRRMFRSAAALTAAAATATMAESSAHEQGEAHHAISAPVQHEAVHLCGTGPAAARRSALSKWCSIRPSPHWQLDYSCRCSVPRLRPLPLRAEEVDDRGARSGTGIGFLSFPEVEEDGSQGSA